MSNQQGSHYSALEQLSNEQLCASCQQGDRVAEEVLASRCHRLVRSVSRPYFLAGGDSEDLLQEGMLAVVKAMREYDPARDACFMTFAEACVRNRLYSVIRAANSSRHSPLNQAVSIDSPLFELDPLFLQTDPELVLIDREKAVSLLCAVCKQLSAFEVRVLDHFLSGLTCSEIAQQLNKPPKSVENAVQRIRRKVARHIDSGDISRS